MRLIPHFAVSLTLVAAVVLLSGCGGDEPAVGDEAGGGGESGAAPTSQQAELQHIHGLGVDPRSSTLFIATHTGLFEAAKGQTKVTRMGESRQDIMGFSVVGPDRFIGSGHPDPTQDLPPNLGLIESLDGGQSWENVSLLGEADFHVLRSSGRKVYGFDGTRGRLMVSDDGGRRWDERTPPAAMFDLAIDPKASDRVVISTERGVFVSADAGKRWRPLRSDTAGLLAWPAPDRLYLIDGKGQALRSGDAGKSFQAAGAVGGQPAAFISQGDELFAALGDGTVKRSADGGASWTLRATP